MQQAEYEIQHFGFSVEQMKLERRHVIRQHLNSLLKHFVSSLIKKSNVSEETAKKMLEAQKEVADEMFASFANTLAQIEKLDEEHFTIPPNVLLHQDFAHINKYTLEDEEKLVNEVEHMQKQFLENSVMISAIEAENAKYLEIHDIIKEEMKVFEAVQETFTAINIQSTRQMVNNTLQTLNKSNSQNPHD